MTPESRVEGIDKVADLWPVGEVLVCAGEITPGVEDVPWLLSQKPKLAMKQ